MIPATTDEVTAKWLAGALDLPIASIKKEPIGVGVGLLGELLRAALDADYESVFDRIG